MKPRFYFFILRTRDSVHLLLSFPWQVLNKDLWGLSTFISKKCAVLQLNLRFVDFGDPLCPPVIVFSETRLNACMNVLSFLQQKLCFRDHFDSVSHVSQKNVDEHDVQVFYFFVSVFVLY